MVAVQYNTWYDLNRLLYRPLVMVTLCVEMPRDVIFPTEEYAKSKYYCPGEKVSTGIQIGFVCRTNAHDDVLPGIGHHHNEGH
jgi:hypothetical protein